MRATRFGLAHVAAALAAAAFALWTWLTLATGILAPLDAPSRTPGEPASSPLGQVLAAIAVVTTPVVVYTGLAALALWAWRRRLQNFAWAIAMSIPLAWGGNQIIKLLVRRPRPADAAPLITAEGWAYPSSHMTAATVLAVLIIAAMVITRRRRATLVVASAGMVVLWWIIFADRWLLRAHWFTDLIGGGFLGGFVAALALALAGVRVVRFTSPTVAPGRPRLAAVVYNPTKVPDAAVFRRHVEGECAERGWVGPLWLETDPDDAGASAARRATRRRADLVLVAGGDGTVRTVCGVLAESGIPVAILPVGTGNLLARNLGVPLDLADALDVAFDGRSMSIDLVQIRADGGEPQPSLVMAGMGADARIMNDTNEDLKKVVGPAAYVMAALTTLNHPPFQATITVDGGEPVERHPALALVANVGQVQGQIAIAPDARPDDGLLDLLIASPKGPGGWGALTTRILTRAPDAPGLERAQGATVAIESPVPVPYQIDGDSAGECRRFEAQVVGRVLDVRVP